MIKNKTLKFRLSADDLDMIRGKADAAGMSMAEFILSCCHAADVPGYVPTIKFIPGQLDLHDIVGTDF